MHSIALAMDVMIGQMLEQGIDLSKNTFLTGEYSVETMKGVHKVSLQSEPRFYE